MIEDKDLQFVYKWFIHYDGSKLSAEVGRNTINHVKNAVGVGAFDKAQQLGQDLAEVAEHIEQVGEIKLITALLILDGKIADIEKFFVARDLIEGAANCFYNSDASIEQKHYHYLSVFSWLRGYVNWQIRNYLQPSHIDPLYPIKRLNQYRIDAFEAWFFCVRVLNDLSYSFLVEEPGWYQEVRWKVTDSLYETRRRDQYYAISKVKHWYPPLYASENTQTFAEEKPVSKEQKRAVRKNIPVYQYVSAGEWGVVNPDVVAYVDIELEDIVIEDSYHRAINLRGKGNVSLRDGVDYAIIRVRGTSMNLLNILDGDYVLIERKRTAQHMDIVLAVLQDIDTEATLKRLYRQGNRIELHPVSNDLKNQILRIESPESLQILGVAIAVFKKKVTFQVSLRNVEGDKLAQDLLKELLRPIVLFDMLYTQLSLINTKNYRMALEYDQTLAGYLKLEILDSNDFSHVLNQTILERNYQLQVLEYNKQLLIQINQLPIQVGKVSYASPLFTDILGFGKAVEQAIEIIEKLIWKGKSARQKAEIELESLKHDLLDKQIKDNIKSDLLEQELRAKTIENELKEISKILEMRKIAKELQQDGFTNDEIQTVFISLLKKGRDFSLINGVELFRLDGKMSNSPTLLPQTDDVKTFSGE